MMAPRKTKADSPAEANLGGAPRKEVDWEQFEECCKILCTKLEICAILKMTDKTLEERCIEKYSEGFSEVYKRLSSGGKKSLRRAMYHNATENNNSTVQIWLSKQHLGMRDIPDIDVSNVAENTVDLSKLPLDLLIQVKQALANADNS